MKPGLFITGLGSYLPTPTTVAEAVRTGLVEQRAVWRTEIESVCVGTESGPQMAAGAARSALAQAGCAPDDIDLLLHANTYFQGHDMWAPASYVQRVAVGNRCLAVEVRQMSNGGLAAVELAAAYLAADAGRTHALVTTGDRFCPPGFDRWRSDVGTVYGDGGTALVLSSRRGFARLCSLATVSDPSLEGMQRGDDPFSDAPLGVRSPVDVEAMRKAFVSEHGLDSVLDRIAAGQQEAVKRALSEAGVELADIDRFVLPNLGRARINEYFLSKLPIDLSRTTWSWGRRVGHLGAGDQIAGLAHLVASGGLHPGERCLLAGVGAGFTWTCAVVQLLRRPKGGTP